MIAEIQFINQKYRVNLNQPIDISIPIKAGDQNPNCYWAEAVQFEVIRSNDFVGSVKEGGPVNYQKLIMTPHGNGTHTECIGHITKEAEAITDFLKQFHFLAQLISVTPEAHGEDYIISSKSINHQIVNPDVSACVIRTLPNQEGKVQRRYSGTNPPYLEPELTKKLNQSGIDHLLVDLPSVDKEIDGGKLMAHRAFWGVPDQVRKHATITELIYVPDEVEDGLYLLNLQIVSLTMDASPSKPILYRII